MNYSQAPTPMSENFNLATIGTQYNATNYSITYPKTWQPSSTQFNGADITTIQSHNVPGNPETIVEYYDASHSMAEEQMLNNLTDCTKGNIMINSNNYQKLQCVYNYRIIDGNQVQGTTQLKMVLIPKTDALYLIKFYYSSPKQDPLYENLASQILSSLQITQ